MQELEQYGYKEQLQRGLTTRDLVVYGLMFIPPIAPYALFGIVWQSAKGMVPLAYLVGLIGMLFTAMSYATMSREIPLAGSVYTYAQKGLHELAGFFAGWLILLDYILAPALLYVISALALKSILPGFPSWMSLVFFVSFNTVVNFLGIEFAARFNWYTLLLELACLALFVIFGLIALYKDGVGAGALTLTPFYDPLAFSPETIVAATSIAVMSFLGFDGISTLSEESKGGLGSVGRATVITLLLVGVLFIGQTWIATDLAQGSHFASPDTAFYEIVQRVGGTWLRLITIGAVVLSAGIANASVAQAAVARILFAMARDGNLPAVLARIHPRHKTPYVSSMLVAVISIIASFVFASHIDSLSRIVNFGALTAFLLLHLSVINYFVVRRRSRALIRHLMCPLLGFVVIAYVLYEMDITAKILGACWLAVGTLYYVVLSRMPRKKARFVDPMDCSTGAPQD
jgi:amino acid transporter